MVDFLAVLLIPVIIAGVWYGVAARSRRLDAEALVAARDREIAQLLDASSETPTHEASNVEGQPAAITFTDPLTSLGTLQLLEKDLATYEGQVARYGLKSCIALIDIDNFKEFNQRHGRDTGNAVIVTIAQRLASRSRSGDSVYRIGGDEFICLLPEQTIETGAVAVERMRRSIDELAIPFEGAPSGFVTVSAGLALLDAQHLKTWPELLKDAEAALARAREDELSAS
ncbi:MAG: GGDEF domain-containing protein [Acidimicrobiales bacterium]